MSVSITTIISNLWPILHATSASDAAFFTDAELTRYIADDLKYQAQKAAIFVERNVGIDLVAGTALYGAPPRHLATLHVAHNNLPLVASSTSELELLDSAYLTTAGTPTRFYVDRNNQNKIGLYPVPNAAAVTASPFIEVVYLSYPCDIDEAHTVTAIDVPAVIGDLLEMTAVKSAYSREGDLQMPEVGRALGGMVDLLGQVTMSYYGENR